MKLRNVALPALALITILNFLPRVSTQTPTHHHDSRVASLTTKPTASHLPVASHHPSQPTNQPPLPSPSENSHGQYVRARTASGPEAGVASPGSIAVVTPIETLPIQSPNLSPAAEIPHATPNDELPPIPDDAPPPAGLSDQGNTATEAPSQNAVLPTLSVPQARQSDPIPTAKATVEEHVFVPLKEWKQKKLEDIESRMRNTKSQQSPKLKSIRDRALRDTTLSANLRNQHSQTRKFPFLIYSHWQQDICPLPSPAQNQLKHRHSNNGSVPIDATENVDERLGDDAHQDELAKNHEYNSADMHVPVEDELQRSIAASGSAESTEGHQVADDGKAMVPEKYVEPGSDKEEQPDVETKVQGLTAADENKPVQSMNYSSLTAELDPAKLQEAVNSLGSRLNPIVGEIVKTIRDASNALSSAPLGGVKDVLGKEGSIVNRSLSQTPFTETVVTQPVGNISRRVSSDATTKSSKKCTECSVDESRKAEKKGSGKSDVREISDVYKRSEFIRVKGKPFNFASADAGARVLSFSNGVVGAKNVISGSIDKYMLAPCAGDGVGGSRWIDLELSEEVILESFETGNFEYYSSSARRVVVLGSETYPPEAWNILGIFDFADVRTLQRFGLDRKGVTRFLRVMYAGKQGNEYYCPISTIRAFGKNLLTDWKDDLDRPGSGYRSSQSNDTKGMDGKAIDSRQGVRSKQFVGSGRSDASREQDGKEIETDGREWKGGDCARRDGIRVSDKRGGSGVDGAEEECEGIRCKGGERGQDGSEDDSIEVKNSEDEKSGSRDDEKSCEEGGNSDSEGISEDDQILLEAMRADALSAVSENDNIFRKVTRMIRVLELNQSLTNQYIDTHLARFALGLSSARHEAGRASEAALLCQASVVRLGSDLDGAVRRLEVAALRRDILLCVVMILIAFLIGIHWVLWGAVTGGRLLGDRGPEVAERSGIGTVSSEEGTQGLSEGEGSKGGGEKEEMMGWTETYGRRKKKKGREKERRVAGGEDGRASLGSSIGCKKGGRSHNAFQVLHDCC